MIGVWGTSSRLCRSYCYYQTFISSGCMQTGL